MDKMLAYKNLMTWVFDGRCEEFNFDPFGEIVYLYYDLSHLVYVDWEGSQWVNAPLGKRLGAHNWAQLYYRSFDILWKLFTYHIS